MTTDEYDLVVIGSGPAGEKGATQAAYYGHRVAVVERRAGAGGSAIAVSGVPVKALRDAALYLSGWSRKETFGVGLDLTPAEVMTRLSRHTQEVVSSMAGAVAANLERHGVDVVHEPDGGIRALRAGTVLLATGSRPHHPEGLPFDDPDVHDSESILSIAALPRRIVIVGGGPVGTEYASILAAVGVEVTLVDPGGRLLPMIDAEVADALVASLERAGATLVLDGRVQSVTRDGSELVVDLGGRALRTDAVLHALGRTGNVEGMGLEDIGVEVGRRGRVVVDRDFRTTVPWVYAAGDITGPPGLASVAMEQARVAMCRAFGIPFKEVLDEFVPTGIYTLPEVSMVGLTEAAARELSADVGTGRTWFSGNARARISGSTEGMLKLVFRASDRTLLGAHILGEEATELIHVAQAVLHRGGAIDEFIDTTFNFPTRADAYKYAAYDGLPPRASTLHHGPA